MMIDVIPLYKSLVYGRMSRFSQQALDEAIRHSFSQTSCHTPFSQGLLSLIVLMLIKWVILKSMQISLEYV